MADIGKVAVFLAINLFWLSAAKADDGTSPVPAPANQPANLSPANGPLNWAGSEADMAATSHWTDLFGMTPLQLSTDATQPASDSHYGPFGWLDHRSVLGTGFFPEPFLVDEGDVDRELAFTWEHDEGHSSTSDALSGEIEWAFGVNTIEIEVPYEYNSFPGPVAGGPVQTESGFDGIEFAIRRPIWQWVSADNNIENSIVGGFEVAFPPGGSVARDWELVPQFFDLLRVGEHFGLQIHVGYSTLTGPDPVNQETLEYSADFSYSLDRSVIPLPKGLDEIDAMFELAGERGLNNGDLSNHLEGVLGARFNLTSIGDFSPRLGIGWVLPIDKQARGDFDWGIVTSLVFDL
jgi:hypothetical protein